MQNSDRYFEIKVNRNLDFLTASTSFYRFLGSRLYSTFDKIMPAEDAPSASDKIFEKELNAYFALRLYEADGKITDFACTVLEIQSEDVRVLGLIDVESLYKSVSSLSDEINNDHCLLSLFDCIYFDYVKSSDKLELFKYTPDYRKIDSPELSDYDEACVSALRNGSRAFTLPLSKHLFEKELSGDDVRMSGIAIYENGEHVRTVGNIAATDSDINYKTVNKDQLTGLMLKDDITAFARSLIETDKKPTTIAIVDIDNFKDVNDTFGHMKGDEVLRKCSSIMENEVGSYGRVGRIGGDEFLIVLAHDNFEESEDEEGIRTILRSVKNDIFSEYTDENDGFHISASIGAATYPLDVDNFTDLFLVADFLLYRAKNKGKNRYIKYNPEKHDPVSKIVSERRDSDAMGLGARKGGSKSDVVCKILDFVYTGKEYSIEKVLGDVIDCFGIERIGLYCLDDKKLIYQCGNSLMDAETAGNVAGCLNDEEILKFMNGNTTVINNIKRLGSTTKIYDNFRKAGIISFMHHRFKGHDSKTYLVSYESLSDILVWNTEDFHFYRLLDHIYENIY